MARVLVRALCALSLLTILFPLSGTVAQADLPSFPDVPPGATYSEAVQQLAAREIVRGYPDGRFGPDDPLLRAQTAVTLVRAMGLTGQTASRNFADQDGTDGETWMAVRLLADRDIARGFPDGTFQPSGVLTRQQALSFISRTMVALGVWQAQASPVPYGDVAAAHAPDVATYTSYVGPVPHTTTNDTGSRMIGADSAATRGWYAEVLWPAVKQARENSAPSAVPSATAVPTPSTSPSPSATPVASPLRSASPSPSATPAPTPGSSTAALPESPYRFGTLLSDSRNAAQLYAAGVRVVHLELGWDAYEPQEGTFNTAYAAAARQKLQGFRAAGLEVVLGVGLQYPPAWAYAYSGSRYVDQSGAAAGPLNLTFNQPLRLKAETYIARVHQDLGLNNFSAVRIGSGGLIEALYPAEDAGGQANGYWAYDVNAQGGNARPASIPVTPFPGWRPGQTTYNGQAFSTTQVQRWYDWYLGAMIDGINWQIGLYKRLGFTGYEQVLLPGLGSRPVEYDTAIASYLNGAGDDNRTMGRGAVWHKVIAGLNDRRNVVIYISSIADGSGGDDVCQASDASVSLGDPRVNNWSAIRWISYNANRYGMPKNGENPGRSDTRSYGLGMLQAAVAQMQGCGLQGLMWAHESNLYDGGSGMTLADYENAILQYRR